jgi:hypothetical protein
VTPGASVVTRAGFGAWRQAPPRYSTVIMRSRREAPSPCRLRSLLWGARATLAAPSEPKPFDISSTERGRYLRARERATVFHVVVRGYATVAAAVDVAG